MSLGQLLKCIKQQSDTKVHVLPSGLIIKELKTNRPGNNGKLGKGEQNIFLHKKSIFHVF